MAVHSDKWHLDNTDWQKWFRSTVEWLAPLGLIYFGSVAIALNDGFVISDFYLTPVLMGALSLYIVNRLYDLSKKFAAGK